MGRPISPEPPHGTRKRYQLRRDPCNCPPCSAANARYRRARRQAALGLPAWEQTTIPADAYETISVPSAH
jgi:hypothetical protein